MKREIKLNELEDFVKEFLTSLGDKNVVGLYGNLGAGKTTFTKEVAKQLGIKDHVTSPTFTLQKIYQLGDSQKFKRLVHIDLYRIESIEEIKILKLEDLFENKENLILIEWADRLNAQESGIRNQKLVKVKIDYKSEESREFEIQNG